MEGGDVCITPVTVSCHQDRGRVGCLGFLFHVGQEAVREEGADMSPRGYLRTTSPGKSL